ncbi:MAG: DUF4921 family protein [Candidatus Sungbacteria bacterium]|uniref:DUF4921 family protein n=1 Tax=Candidatus Sungiibacteriota bacterium TaxID=2750080 RepID=A0A931SBS5_9BACT|nr:DUF4921 family protein [Candidatus Sungbacteria bacterium]
MPGSENPKPISKYSELRQDIVSGDWVVIATGRARRPNDFIVAAKAGKNKDDKDCPFEKLEDSALLIITRGNEHFADLWQAGAKAKDWFIEVIPNKFPAFTPRQLCPSVAVEGVYRQIGGVGFHEVIVMRPHDRSIALMSVEEVTLLVTAYRERFKTLKPEQCVQYVSVIHNHGPESGASIVHPHSQLIAIPVIPPDVFKSLAGSLRYFTERQACVHCAMIEYEARTKLRVIFENEKFIAFAPYASRAAFEIRIFPKSHRADFENIPEEDLKPFAQALQRTLAVLYHGLKNPSYNFFIHTAPTDGGRYAHYHWHLEILPKTSIWGGFEFGTGIEISTIAPEDAAAFLRSVKLPPLRQREP